MTETTERDGDRTESFSEVAPASHTTAGTAVPPTLSDQLRAFAAEVGAGTWAQLLERLADGLASGSDLHLWGSVNLFEMFGNAGDLVQPPRPAPWKRAVIAAPAVLVFMPLLVTWSGLAQATAAYRRALASDPTLVGRSFLEMWQTGMAGELNPFFTFDRAAILTLTSLIILVVAVVLAGVLRHRQAEAVEDFDVTANQKLHALLAEASLAIAEEKLTAPDRFIRELNLAAQEIRELQAETKKLSSNAARAATSAGKSADTAASASETLTYAVGRLDTSVTEIGRAVHDAKEATASQSVEATRSAQATAATLGATLAASLGEVNQTARTVASLHDELKDLVRSLDQQVARAVADGVSSGTGPIAQAVGELARSADSLSVSASKSLADSRQVVADQQTTVDSAHARLEDTVKHVEGEFATAVHNLTSSLQGQVSGIESAADSMGQVSSRFDDLRRALDALAVELGQVRRSVELIDGDRRMDGRPRVGLSDGS